MNLIMMQIRFKESQPQIMWKTQRNQVKKINKWMKRIWKSIKINKNRVMKNKM